MKNTASQYCKTLNRVTKAELVNALHQALMQLNAAQKQERDDGWPRLDHKHAIAEASRIMAKAGHLGFPIPVPINPANIVTIDAVAKTGKSSTLAP